LPPPDFGPDEFALAENVSRETLGATSQALTSGALQGMVGMRQHQPRIGRLDGSMSGDVSIWDCAQLTALGAVLTPRSPVGPRRRRGRAFQASGLAEMLREQGRW
jgi:hypothetical protein